MDSGTLLWEWRDLLQALPQHFYSTRIARDIFMVADRDLNQADEHLPGIVIVFHVIQGFFQMFMGFKIATGVEILDCSEQGRVVCHGQVL